MKIRFGAAMVFLVLLTEVAHAQSEKPDMEILVDDEIKLNVERYASTRDSYTSAEKLYLLRGGKNLCGYARDEVRSWNLCMDALLGLANGSEYKKMNSLCKIAVPSGSRLKECMKEAKAMSDTVAGYRKRQEAAALLSNLESSREMSVLKQEAFKASQLFNSPAPPNDHSLRSAVQ